MTRPRGVPVELDRVRTRAGVWLDGIVATRATAAETQDA